LRLADAEFLAGQTLDLPKLQLQLRALQIDKIQLETGPPRTDACIVYLFLIVLPIRTVHAGPNPKYFGQLKGVTWYNCSPISSPDCAKVTLITRMPPARRLAPTTRRMPASFLTAAQRENYGRYAAPPTQDELTRKPLSAVSVLRTRSVNHVHFTRILTAAHARVQAIRDGGRDNSGHSSWQTKSRNNSSTSNH
jgi:hypothetical protein